MRRGEHRRAVVRLVVVSEQELGEAGEAASCKSGARLYKGDSSLGPCARETVWLYVDLKIQKKREKDQNENMVGTIERIRAGESRRRKRSDLDATSSAKNCRHASDQHPRYPDDPGSGRYCWLMERENDPQGAQDQLRVPLILHLTMHRGVPVMPTAQMGK